MRGYYNFKVIILLCFLPLSTIGCTTGIVRLADGTYANQGRVEICVNNAWGTVCRDYFDINDAKVVCHQLGYPSANAYYNWAYFGHGKGSIWLDDLGCSGSELTLLQCYHRGLGSHNCYHGNDDVGVRCSGIKTGTCINGDVRLVDGFNSTSGRVEVCADNQWGTVCDDSWDNNDAKVVCRMLSYPSSSAIARGSAYFDQGSGSILLDNVHCTGNEVSIFSCSHNSIGSHNCDHSQDAGVVCLKGTCTNGDIRLAGSSNSTSGRVEVCANNQWGTVCDDVWDNNDAKVVCRMLNYSSSGAIARHSAYFGQGSGSILLDDVQCTGNEASIFSCSHNGIGSSNCDHSEDAGVVCIMSDGTIGIYRNGITSSSYYYGIIQIHYNGKWGNICDDVLYDQNEADVICHQLGYTGASSYSRAGLMSYGTDYNSVLLNRVICDNNNYLNILQCSYSTHIRSGCNLNYYDATVYCYTTRIWDNNAYPGMIRLQGGGFSNLGRVEVYCNGQWGTICDNGFSSTDANIICKQLGYTGYTNYNQLSMPASSSKPIWISNMISSHSDSCFGDSNTCPSTAITGCSHTNDVTIECAVDKPYTTMITRDSCAPIVSEGTIRLYRNGVASSSYYYGIVQIYINNKWGNICDDTYYSQYEADVICHQLGYTGASNHYSDRNSSYGIDRSPMLMDNVSCPLNNYLTILQCFYSTIINCEYVKSNNHDATVSCYATRIWDSNPYSGMIRLHGGIYSNEGRVEVYCNGQWGTICDDGFDSNDALLLCKQLGYSNYISYNHLLLPGNSSQHIWMSNLACSNSFSCLGSCQSCPINPNDRCSHSEDVTLQCSNPKKLLSVSTLRTTCHVSSNIPGAVSGGIGSILLIAIVALMVIHVSSSSSKLS